MVGARTFTCRQNNSSLLRWPKDERSHHQSKISIRYVKLEGNCSGVVASDKAMAARGFDLLIFRATLQGDQDEMLGQADDALNSLGIGSTCGIVSAACPLIRTPLRR